MGETKKHGYQILRNLQNYQHEMQQYFMLFAHKYHPNKHFAVSSARQQNCPHFVPKGKSSLIFLFIKFSKYCSPPLTFMIGQQCCQPLHPLFTAQCSPSPPPPPPSFKGQSHEIFNKYFQHNTLTGPHFKLSFANFFVFAKIL